MDISFAVQGHPTGHEDWLALARRAEDLGFEALSIADHPGTTASPFVALAAAAQVTTRLLLAPAVINAGAWEPLALAAEVATLDVVSDGRAVLGIGAGHTPSEWIRTGRPYPTPGERLDRLDAVVTSVRRLLAGERVTVDHETFRLRDAALEWPTPPRAGVPVLIGGNARALVRTAARQADVLELTGLGRTLPDGHSHQVDWTAAAIDERVGLLRATSRRSVRLGALVQKVEITEDPDSAVDAYRALVDEVSGERAPTIVDLVDTPFVLIGTEDQIADQLRANRSRWGLTRYTTRAGDLEHTARIIERLAPQ